MRKHFDAEDDSTALVVPEQAMRMMPCLWCRDATPVSVLNHLGARCSRCYAAYCRAPQPAPHVADKRTQGPLAWAHLLRRREETGERLTPPQRSAWRKALQRQDALRQDADDQDLDYAARERRQAEQERIRQYAAERGIEP